MTPRTAIEARDVSKRYHISGLRNTRLTTKEMLANIVRQPIQRLRSVMRGVQPTDADREFWALRDVSFDVYEGETLGIIGVNGSGKSTLLRIISNITHPTSGYVLTRGRVGTLLEVGSGFNYDLSGRENLYVNAITLGMTHREVRENQDSILDFAEIHDFIDTPLKRYSTGMVMRLAFSIAVHLKPEILIVDEVIAVGDAAFIDKSFAKVKEIARSGTTVILVSHLMGFVQQLCDRVLWLDKGRVVELGDVETVSNRYLQTIMPPAVPVTPPVIEPEAGVAPPVVPPVPLSQSERHVATLRAAANAAYPSEWFVIVDPQGRILTVSDKLMALAAPEAGLNVGQSLSEFADEQAVRAVTTALEEQRSFNTRAVVLGREMHVAARPMYASSAFIGDQPIATLAVFYPVRYVAEFPAIERKRLQIRRVELIPLDEGNPDAGLLLRFNYDVNKEAQTQMLSVDVRDRDGRNVFYSNDDFRDEPVRRDIGSHVADFIIPTALLCAGPYHITYGFWSPEQSYVEDAPDIPLAFVVPERENRLFRHGFAWPSTIYLPRQWRAEQAQPESDLHLQPEGE